MAEADIRGSSHRTCHTELLDYILLFLFLCGVRSYRASKPQKKARSHAAELLEDTSFLIKFNRWLIRRLDFFGASALSLAGPKLAVHVVV